MPLHYRSAVAEDIAECIVLRGKTRENAVPEARLAQLGITVQSWGDDVRSGALPGYLCLADGRLAGYCFGAVDTGEVVVLALLPEFENQGIGRELLQRVIKLLTRDGHTTFSRLLERPEQPLVRLLPAARLAIHGHV